MCLKRLITVPFERSEPFYLLRLMGVSVPSLHIESTDSMIYIYIYHRVGRLYICRDGADTPALTKVTAQNS